MTATSPDTNTPHDARDASGTSLALRLRTETADIHRLAERSGVMANLLRGRMQRAEYVALLRALHVVYDALEQRLEALEDDAVVRPFRHRALDRASAIARDLTTLHGNEWSREIEPVPSARAYAERISGAAPHGIVAHAYVRYLGDLSGGRSLGRVVARALAIDTDDGLAFYRFDDIPDTEAFKQSFRNALDNMPLERASQDELVAEALEAFAFNVKVFEEVATQNSSSAEPPPMPAA